MRQPTIDELFDKLENEESINEIKESMKDKIITKDISVTVNKTDELYNENKFVEVKKGNEIYRTWKVKFIRPLIIKFLKELYPDSLIVREVNKIDITLFDNQTEIIIPIEIQKVPTIKNKAFGHAEFEQKIRKQVEDNIENYGKCWLFIDLEYLRFLQSGNVGNVTNIDMTWIIKLMRDDTLKVFAINYNEVTKELTTKDFDFLKKLSQICIMGHDNDKRELNRNKLKIYKNIIKGYNFTQEEITNFENAFDNRNDTNIERSILYFTTSDNKRCKLYGNILEAVGALPSINNILSCTIDKTIYTTYAITIGLFHQNEFYGVNKNARIQFIDKFDIAQYFPGYLRNKEMWDYCKNKQRIFTIPEFRGIIEGREHCLKLIKNQSMSLEDY